MEVMQKLEGSWWASSLDLNMGYYTIWLNPDAQCICTVITSWGKYKYLCLPMGISCMLDIFQEKMSTLMRGLELSDGTSIWVSMFVYCLREKLVCSKSDQ